MKIINETIVNFLHNQGFVIVSTIDSKGFPHNSCKGIVKIDRAGKVFLFDVYRGETLNNLKRNHRISITAVDEHKFIGFCLKGKGRLVNREEIEEHFLKAWEERITSRLTQRLLKNIHEDKGSTRHPEALFPDPKYLIEVDVEEIIDLTPHHLK